MLSQKMQDALNDQINAEYFSSYLYLAMSAWCQEANLPGMASWFRVQAQEEMLHVMKFFQYVIDRKGRVLLAAIAKPDAEWKGSLDVFQAAYAHEQHVTARINKLVGLAIGENDYATHTLLQWFVNEQVEEEATVDAIVQQLKLADEAPAALFMLDRELGTRQFTPTAAAAD